VHQRGEQQLLDEEAAVGVLRLKPLPLRLAQLGLA